MNRYIVGTVLAPLNSGTDCTMNGFSVQKKSIAIPVKDGILTEEDVDRFGYVKLVLRDAPFLEARPAFKEAGEKGWTMFGGNYITASDSRFMNQYGGPIALHDRIEDK